jgi:VanZ family protein
MTPLPASRRRAWWAVVAWLVFQLTLTSLPGSVIPRLSLGIRLDWVAHFGMYFVLGVLVARAGIMGGWGPARLALMWVAIAALGVADEMHEMLIPNRSAELMDWIMDAAGSWFGLALTYLVKGRTWAATALR